MKFEDTVKSSERSQTTISLGESKLGKNTAGGVLGTEVDAQFQRGDDSWVELNPLTEMPHVLPREDRHKGHSQTLAESSAVSSFCQHRDAPSPEPSGIPSLYSNWPSYLKLRRRDGYLNTNDWSVLKTQAELRGVKSSTVLLTAYAEILSAWSGYRRIDLGVVRRSPLRQHGGYGEFQGSPASLAQVDIDFQGEIPFWKKVWRLQEQIQQVGRCNAYDGDSDSSEWCDRREKRCGIPQSKVIGCVVLLEQRNRRDAVGSINPLTVFEQIFGELGDGRLHFTWKVSEAYFPKGIIECMWQAFNGLLSRLANEPAIWGQSSLDLSPCTQRPVVYREGELPRGVLQDSLAKWALVAPYKPVVETSAGVMTYQSLDAESTIVARTLALLGVREGVLVPVVMDRGACFVTALLGILKVGAAFLAIEPDTGRDRLHAIVEDSRASVVLTQTHYALLIEWPETVEVISVNKLSSTVGEFLPRLTEPDSLAYVIHASDEAAKPKGIMIDHLGALNTIVDINRRFQVGPDDKVFGVSSCSSDRSVYDIFGMLQAGASVVYPEPVGAQNPTHWIEVMSARGVTIWNSDAAMASLIVEVASRQGRVLSALRLVLLSAGDIPGELPARIRGIAPKALIVSLGGVPEASIWSSYAIIESTDQEQKKNLLGEPLVNQGWLICDAHGRSVPTWTMGELCLNGVGLSPGYWEDEEGTRRKFFNGLRDGVRLFRTGTHGYYLPDGSIELFGDAFSQTRLIGRQCTLVESKSETKAVPLLNPVTSELLPHCPDTSGSTFRLFTNRLSHVAEEKDQTGNFSFRPYRGDISPALMSGVNHVNKNSCYDVGGQVSEKEKSHHSPLVKVPSGNGIEQ